MYLLAKKHPLRYKYSKLEITVLTYFYLANAHSRVTYKSKSVNKQSRGIKNCVWAGKCHKGDLVLPKMAVFPDLLEWSPTLRRTLWRCRNVGFPRPECRVTAPISAVWWPEEEATEILAWRKKKRDDDGGKTRRDFLLRVGISAETEERSNRTLTRLSGWTPPCLCASVPVCLPLRRVKNWVRGVPLLGGQTS